MAIIPGNAQDGVRTGLAGRIANAVVAAFAALGVPIAVTYPVGRNHLPGMNSLVQGIVDALNIDKVGVDQRTPKGSSSASQVGTTFGPLATAGGWTDLTGTSQTFTPQSILRSIKAVLCFSGFVDTAVGGIQIRLVVDGTPISTVYPAFWNALSSHQGWAFQWVLAPGSMTAAAHTVKVQVQVPSG